MTGTIRDLSTVSFEVADILLMDKGDGASTSYEFDEDVANFIMDKCEADPRWLSVKIGHIHSHHSMSVFFSGTDMDELKDNCANHNFYLSLIVNNYGEMIAKLVYKVTPCAYTASDENGEEYEIGALGNEKSLMFSYDCQIETPFQQEDLFDDFFNKRLVQIIKKADEKPKKVYQAPANSYQGNSKGSIAQSWDKNGYGGSQQGAAIKKLEEKPNPAQMAFDKLTQPNEKQEEYINLELTKFDLDEQFACFCVRFGEFFDHDDLEQALAVIKDEGVDGLKLSSTIMDNIVNYYDKFTLKMLSVDEIKELTMDDFLSTLENVVDNLGDYEGKYPIVTPLIGDLQHLIHLTENNWREAVPKFKEEKGK